MKKTPPYLHLLVIPLLLFLFIGGTFLFPPETGAQEQNPESPTVITDAQSLGAPPSLSVPVDFEVRPQLTEGADTYLVTIYPGEELYSSFGHTAIRIKDPAVDLDILYNYGQSSVPFDSGFVPHFVKGQLPFMLGVIDTERAYNFYIKHEDRTIYEQRLNLSNKKKTELYRFLAFNALPENRVYIYDFFFDNCTTRIRDIFTYLFGSSMSYRLAEQEMSFREIIAPYLYHTPFISFGIDLVFGSVSDKKPALEDRLFLPFQLMDAVENAETASEESPLEGDTRFVYRQKRPDPKPPAVGPGLLLWILAATATAASLGRFRYSVPARIMDGLIFGLAGLLGSLMLLLWLFSGYEMATANYNLLWAWPPHIIAAFIGFRGGRRHRLLFYYFAAASAIAAVFLAVSPFIPQTLPSAAVPFILALIVRSINRIIPLPFSRVAEKPTSH
ncbi:MAG: DUF4105 domain-containing protein [Spirochaetia bacterium]